MVSWIQNLMQLAVAFLVDPTIPSVDGQWIAQSPGWTSRGEILFFTATSTSISTECASDPDGYLITPIVPQSAHKIVVDGVTVASTHDDNFSYAGNLYSSLIVSCRNLLGATQVRWEVFTKTHIFTKLSSWPRVVPVVPANRAFTSSVILIAAGALLGALALCLALFVKKISKEILTYVLGACLACALAFLSWVPRELGLKADPLLLQKFSDSSTWIGSLFCALIFFRLGRFSSLWAKALTSLTALGIALIILAESLDQVQIGSNLAIASQLGFMIGFSAYNFFRVFWKRETSTSTVGQLIGGTIFSWSAINDLLYFSLIYFTEKNEATPLFPIGTFAVVVVVALLVNQQIKATYEERDALRLKSAKEAATTQLAQQVAHDIRSPIASLNLLEAHMGDLPEQIRVATRSAITRIKDIANTLSKTSRNETRRSIRRQDSDSPDYAQPEGRPTPLYLELESVLSEKRIETQDRPNIEYSFSSDPSTLYCFSSINAIELARALSNLINNAVEAIGNSGKISISLSRTASTADPRLEIAISDNGIGIPPHILARLGERGLTSGKGDLQSGEGLGVWHAKKTIEEMGGTLAFQSRTERGSSGTRVLIQLPEVTPPPWFCSSLTVGPGMTVVVLDDDDYIHAIWRKQFQSLVTSDDPIKLVHFTGPTELSEYVFRDSARKNHLYLMDHDLTGHKVTGIKLIEGLGLNDCAILVTSRYGQTEIQEKCVQLGVRILPKTLAHQVRIVLS